MKNWKHFTVMAFLAIFGIVVGFNACDDSNNNTPAHTHDSGEWITTLEPTCTEAGSKELRCTADGTVLNTDTIVALGHDWGEWEETTPPIITVDGVETKICRRNSSHNETRPIDALATPFFGTWIRVDHDETFIISTNFCKYYSANVLDSEIQNLTWEDAILNDEESTKDEYPSGFSLSGSWDNYIDDNFSLFINSAKNRLLWSGTYWTKQEES